jgi:mRNA-degrading endonuclease RelE of RelBE toxin-antitoxin system
VYKDLSGLEKDRKRQGALLDAAIQGISEQHSGAIKKLKGGLKNYYRLELGNIRVIYYRRGDEAIIVRIGNRKDVYR